MKKEEMAKAYAEGFAKEYREIAYDAFLCGYDAKCSTETPNDLEEAAVDIADALLAKSRDYILSAEADYWNGAHDGIIAGAKWQKEQIMKEAIDAKVDVYEQYEGKTTGIITTTFADIPTEDICGGVRIIIVKED